MAAKVKAHNLAPGLKYESIHVASGMNELINAIPSTRHPHLMSLKSKTSLHQVVLVACFKCQD